jgi:hypothetical protein
MYQFFAILIESVYNFIVAGAISLKGADINGVKQGTVGSALSSLGTVKRMQAQPA